MHFSKKKKAFIIRKVVPPQKCVTESLTANIVQASAGWLMPVNMWWILLGESCKVWNKIRVSSPKFTALVPSAAATKKNPLISELWANEDGYLPGGKGTDKFVNVFVFYMQFPPLPGGNLLGSPLFWQLLSIRVSALCVSPPEQDTQWTAAGNVSVPNVLLLLPLLHTGRKRGVPATTFKIKHT